ncbi:hypothetical protein [Baekduia sp. Peel2402]|uniref:hypothetical protein n=1 Tax=Baekduia sp. Peel2402 TaxID=3458296 RepID=UPI00403ED8F4
MHVTPRRGGPRSSQPFAAEDGFALIEVMVSAVLLIGLALATLSLIDNSQASSSQQRSKGIASALASADLGRMRQTKFTTSTNFTTTATTRGVDNINYTVTSKGEWTSAAGVLTTCTKPSTGNPGQYVRLTSTVTWPGMGAVKPVTAETLLVPRSGEVAITAGAFSLKVLTAAGSPVAGVSVVMNGQTLVTSAAGCVVFTSVPPGTYNVTYSKSGYIATSGATPGIYVATVTKGTTASKTVGYDIPAKITPVPMFREVSGLPSTTPTTAGWTSYSVSAGQGVDFLGTYLWNATNAGSGTSLYPFIGGYQVYAGNCAGNNPALYDGGFGTTFPLSSVAPDPGTAAIGTAYMRQATIKVSGAPNNQKVGVYLLPSSTSADMAGCDRAFAPTALQAANSSTVAMSTTFDAPYGIYTYCIDNGASTQAAGRRYVYPAASNAYNNTPANGSPSPTTATPTLDYTKVSGGTGVTGLCSVATS